MKYKSGDLCVVNSKNSYHNGKVVEVIKYTEGKCNDILQVKLRSHTFFIKESSLKLANKYDIIRNLSDKQLKRLLNKHIA